MDKRQDEISNADVSTGGNGQSGAPPESGALPDFLRDSREQLEGLLTKSQQLQEESSRHLHALFEELHARLCRELEGVSTSFMKDVRRQAQYEATAVLEVFEVEADARISARLDEALAKSRDVYEKLESSLKERTEDYQRSLTELATSSLQTLQSKGESLLDEFRTELRLALDSFSMKGRDEAADHLGQTSRELTDHIRAEAENTLAAMSQRLTESGKAVVDETEKQISAQRQAALEVLRKQAFETLHRETSEFLLHDLRKRLDRVANAIEQVNMGPPHSGPEAPAE